MPRCETPITLVAPSLGSCRSSRTSTSTPSSPRSRSSRTRAPGEAARRRRRPARARRRVDRELRGARVRDPLGDELRRGASPLPARRLRPRPAMRSTASTRGRSGTRSRRSSRASSGRGSTRATSTSGPSRADFVAAREGRRGDPDRRCGRRRASGCSLGVGDVEGRLQDRVRPPEARRDHRRPAGRGGALPRAARGPAAARASGRGPRRGCARAGVDTIGGLAALSDADLGAVLPGSRRPAPARPRTRHRPARPRARAGAGVGLARRTRSRATSPTASRCTSRSAGSPSSSSERLRNSGLSGAR